MRDKAFAVRRQAVRPFLVALAGVPLLAVMYDFLTGSRLLTRFGEIIYRGDLDAFEARDFIWASVFATVGTLALAWGLRELLFPRRILTIDESGLMVSVSGPFRSPVRVPWTDVDALRVGEMEIDGDVIPTLDLTVLERGLLPGHPWSGRWKGANTLALDTVGWDRTPNEILAVFDSQRRTATVMGQANLEAPMASGTLDEILGEPEDALASSEIPLLDLPNRPGELSDPEP